MKKIFFFVLIALGLGFNVTSQVGIGTSSPSASAILELKSNTKGLVFPRTSTTTRVSMVGVKGLMIFDTTLHQFYYHTGTSWQSVTSGPHPPNFWSVSPVDDDDIYANPTGNVGIGTWQPPYKFSVTGTVYVSASDKTTLRLGGTGSTTEARILWELPGNTTDFNITQYLNSLYISRTSGASGFLNDFVMKGSGYIGIGTSLPETKLNIIGGTDVTNSAGGYLQLGPENDLNIGFDNNEIQARNNGVVTRLHLNNGGGTVQIGGVVAPTTYSLAVDGRVICEELKIQASSNWADYVFAENYSLKSFDELRNFIQIHHHLPNIPDADTIEKNGIEIGDMQKRMMEKIEELTLYILQLEEKSRAHEKEIQALKVNHHYNNY